MLEPDTSTHVVQESSIGCRGITTRIDQQFRSDHELA